VINLERNPFIKKSDLQKDEHFPIYVFFNLIKEGDFLEVCKNFSKGIGQGIEVAVCLFLDDVDIEANEFDGVEFSLHSGEEIVVDYSTFYWYLNKACQRYIELHPADNEEVKEYLNMIKVKFDIFPKS